MDLYELTIPLLKRMLGHVSTWLDKATSYARARKFDAEVLAQARLAPDQFTLTRQIQSACDAAKFAAAKLCGREPPSNPDTEKTFDELRVRIRNTIAYLDGFSPADFAGSEERPCRHKWMEGRWLRGRDYVERVVLPNFFFHVTTVYAILRHNGVDIGKDDYLGEMPYAA